VGKAKLYTPKAILQFSIMNRPISFGFFSLAQGPHGVLYIRTVTSSNPATNFLIGILLFTLLSKVLGFVMPASGAPFDVLAISTCFIIFLCIYCKNNTSLTHLGAVKGYARASNLVNKSGSEPQLLCTPYC
jgi:hypothetical protein